MPLSPVDLGLDRCNRIFIVFCDRSFVRLLRAFLLSSLARHSSCMPNLRRTRIRTTCRQPHCPLHRPQISSYPLDYRTSRCALLHFTRFCYRLLLLLLAICCYPRLALVCWLQASPQPSPAQPSLYSRSSLLQASAIRSNSSRSDPAPASLTSSSSSSSTARPLSSFACCCQCLQIFVPSQPERAKRIAEFGAEKSSSFIHLRVLIPA